MTAAVSTRNDLGAPPPPIVAGRLLALQARLLRLGGAPEQALRTFDATASHAAAATFEHAATALTLGHHDLARKLIDPIRSSLDSAEPLDTVECLLLLAWLADADGSADEVRTHLAAAMAEAERHVLVEVFVRAGSTILRLISGHPDMQRSAFGERVLNRAREVDSPSPGEELVDPLTDRELEILSYLPSRYTNTELAEHFYVSVNTIKTHMAHIYRKLEVANRNGAIVRAREIGVL